MSERYRGKVRAPEFPVGMEWLNVERPLTIRALRGKVLLLDFWTFCCINCQHVLPALAALEERFRDELVVIGVHSAKFDAEKERYNLQSAVMRLEVDHPVVNDRNFLIWRAYAIRAWPTLAVVDPTGMIVGVIPGEFDPEALGAFLQQIIEDFDARGEIDRRPISLALERHKQLETPLSFPGRVLADLPGDRLLVSDTGHHRLLLFRLSDGKLRAVFGCGEPGLTDGARTRARFHSPQGLALRNGQLFVADTGNHVIRKIALDSGLVSTIAGTGTQARPEVTAGPGKSSVLNSPWGLAAAKDGLYIAMAGAHQLWKLNPRTETLELFVGDGREALLDGPRLHSRLAQPSGLAVDGGRVWFADSESSSLRSAPLPGSDDEEVRTHLGQGLFEFGDAGGDRRTARLQHPLDVACADGLIYIADTYNNKVKVFDPTTAMVYTLSGSGEPALEDGSGRLACFWEPGALCVAGEYLYVADTNNHAIRKVHRSTGAVSTVELELA